MDRLIRKTLFVCLFGMAAIMAQSEEESVAILPDIVISTGVEGGGYWSAGDRFQTVAGEMGLEVENLPSMGSLDNLEKLLDPENPVNMAFAQADAVQHYLLDHSDDRRKLDTVENVGQECVFIITGGDSVIASDVDLQKAKGLRLGISSANGGAAVTYRYMASRVPELADIEVVYGDTREVVAQLNSATASVDAVMMVHRPREFSDEVSEALSNPEEYQFVKLSDERLIAKLPSGEQVYRSMNLAMPGATEPVKTICVRGLLLGNKEKLNGVTRNRVTDLVSYHWMRVYATP